MLSYFQKQETEDDNKKLFSQVEEDGISIDPTMYEKAKNDVGEGFYMIGDAYYNRETPTDYQKALTWYRKAGEKDYAAGINDVGHIYMLGLGTDINYTLAMENYLKAADLKLPMGMYNVGYMYRFGMGVDVNYPLAIEWFNKAMDQGSEYAPNLLGLMYLNGFGVDVDFKRAMSLLIKAKEGGSNEAPYNIGTMYEKGCGVSVDYLTALEWYTMGLDRGCLKAQGAIDLLNKRGYHLKEQVPEEINESVQEREEKKEKLKTNRRKLKTTMREDEKDKQEVKKRVLALEDDTHKTNEKIEKYKVESDGLESRVKSLEEMLETLTTEMRKFKKPDELTADNKRVMENTAVRSEGAYTL